MKKKFTSIIGLLIAVLCFQGFAQESKKKTYVTAIEQHLASKSQERSLLSANLREATNPELSTAEVEAITSLWIMKDDMVKVMARCIEGRASELKSELETLGMQGAKVYGSVVNGWVPLAKLPLMEQCQFLRKASPEIAPQPRLGSVDSEAALRTAVLSNSLGVDGTGIKIGIISVSYDIFEGAADGVASGDLPGAGNPNGFTQEVQVLSEIENVNRANDEGRAMAELIHDIAPGAELFLYSAFNGFFDFADGIRALAAAGCDVIVDDIGYFTAPVFQDGAVAQAVNEVKEQGVVYFSSAGNSSNDAFLTTFSEDEESFESIENSTIETFNFEDENELGRIFLANNTRAVFWLHWDDASILANNTNPTETDLAIAIFNDDGELVEMSEIDNIEEGLSYEFLGFTNTTGEVQGFDVVVVKVDGPDPKGIYFFDTGAGSFVSAGSGAPTVYGHPNAEGAIAVGASSFFRTQDFGQPENVINGFSSLGGIPTFLDAQGNDIVPVTRQKPDIVGMDGISNTFFGGDFDFDGTPNFFGTSASAPNVAALAALMLQLKPDLTPDEIKDLLISTAEDMDDPATDEFDEGFDFKTGFGYVNGDTVLATLAGLKSVYRFELLNANTGELVQVLNEGSNVDLAIDAGRGQFNIQALTLDEDPLFVRFRLRGRQFDAGIDRNAPYLLNREGSDPWEAKVGDFSISGQVFSRFDGSVTTPPPTQTVNFSVVNSAFVQDVSVIENGAQFEEASTFTLAGNFDLDLTGVSEEALENLNIEPLLTSSLGITRFGAPTPFFEEINYKITGPNISYERTVSNEDFSAFEDEEGNVSSWLPTPVNGEYTIETTVFARAGDPDSAGETISLVVNVTVPEIDAEAETKNPDIVTQDAKEMFTMSPNPATDVVNVNVSNETNLIAVSLYDINGNKVYSKVSDVSESMQIDVSQFASGLYILSTIDADGEQFSKKLFVSE